MSTRHYSIGIAEDVLNDVLGKATILRDTTRAEVLAEKRVSAPAVKAVVAGNADVRRCAVADLESLHVLTHLDDLADSLVARNELAWGGKRGRSA
jgi:hypothetical protein